MVVREDTSPKPTGTLQIRTDIFATPEKMKAESDKAQTYIEGASHLRAINKTPFANLYENAEKVTDTRTAQEQRSAIKTFEHQMIEAQESAHQQRCENAWLYSAGEGDRSIRNWRQFLVDGACDENIIGLDKIREQKLKETPLKQTQNKNNCPDCKEFQ